MSCQHLILMIFNLSNLIIFFLKILRLFKLGLQTSWQGAHALAYYQVSRYQPSFTPRNRHQIPNLFMGYTKALLFIIVITKPGFSTFANKNHDKLSDNITITSDSLNLDNHNLSASFKGSVTVIFEDMTLKTNYLKIYYINHNNKRSIEKIEIPVHLKAIKKITDEIVVADSGEYIVALNKLTLKGNVRMQKDKNILVTDTMIYFTKLKLMPTKR